MKNLPDFPYMCFLLRKSCSRVNLQCKSPPKYIVHFTTLPRSCKYITLCTTSSINCRK